MTSDKKRPAGGRRPKDSKMPEIKVTKVEKDLEFWGKIWLSIALAVGMVGIAIYVYQIISTIKVVNGKLTIDYLSANFAYLTMGLLAINSYGFYVWHVHKIRRLQEEKFSELLRDMAEYWKVGLSMAQAINTLAKGEYGVLNKEIKKMSVLLSWGVAFNDVLLWLADQLKSKLVYRSVSLILEANKAGGKISDVLMTAAKDVNEIRWIKTEREKGMKMYVMVIYISFGVYLAVIFILVSSFLPAIINASKAIIEASGGGTTASLGSMQIRKISKDFILFIFFWSLIIQSIGNGLMAGVMGYGKVSAGMGHVFVMILMSWLLFITTGDPHFIP